VGRDEGLRPRRWSDQAVSRSLSARGAEMASRGDRRSVGVSIIGARFALSGAPGVQVEAQSDIEGDRKEIERV